MKQQEYVTQMTELGSERDQSSNENTELDQNITDLNLQKNMVDIHTHLFLFIL